LSKTWRCHLPWTFFGLDDEYIAAVYEEFFMLKYHGGWNFTEAYNLPIKMRRWFLERLVKQKEDEKKAIEEQINKNQGTTDRG